MKTLALWLCLCVAASAQLRVAQPEQEVHAKADVREVEVAFAFENAGSEPVTFASLESSCSCVRVGLKDDKRRYEPGEKGTVEAVFEVGNFSGAVHKAIQGWVEGDPQGNPSLKLGLTIHVPVLVAMEPKTLRWDQNGNGGTKEIEIRMQSDDPIRVKRASALNENFGLEVETVEEGRHYRLKVTPKSTVEAMLAVFQIETDCRVERHRTQRAFATIRPARP